jgi:hypothetical protein
LAAEGLLSSGHKVLNSCGLAYTGFGTAMAFTILFLPSHPTAYKSFRFVVTLSGFVGALVLVQATLHAIPKAPKLMPLRTGKRESLVLLLASGLINLVPAGSLIVICLRCELAEERFTRLNNNDIP